MDRRRSEMYGTVGTKFSFVFVFELYRYKVGTKSLKKSRVLNKVNGAMFEKA